MNVEIGTEAAVFPEKEYINGIFLAVQIQIRILGCVHRLTDPAPDLVLAPDPAFFGVAFKMSTKNEIF